MNPTYVVRTRRTVCLLGAVLVLLALLAAPARRAEAAGIDPQISWLAAGDSFSAGQGLAGNSPVCAQSPDTWALAAAKSKSLKLANTPDLVACTGATMGGAATGNTWGNQEAQALNTGHAPYDLITFTFGGNDIGFPAKIMDCIGFNQQLLDRAKLGTQIGGESGLEAAILAQIVNHRCSFTLTELRGAIATFKQTLHDTLSDILSNNGLLKADGHVVVAGYPLLIANTASWVWYAKAAGYCNGISAADVDLLTTGAIDLNRAIKDDVTGVDPNSQRVTFLDVNKDSGSFQDHGMCSQNGPWINGVSSFLPNFHDMFHPNQAGYDYYASKLVATLNAWNLRSSSPTTAGTTTTSTSTTTTTTVGVCGLTQTGQVCNPGTPPPVPKTTATTKSPSLATTTSTRPVSVTKQVTVGAASGWVDTGVAVRAGDYDTMVANGSWFPGSPATAPFGPDGTTQEWQDNFFNLTDIGVCQYCATTATGHWGSLIGYIGSAPPPPGSYSDQNILPEAKKVFVVGSSYPGMAATSGELWLAMNDDAYSGVVSDNTGQVQVLVAVIHQS